MERYRGNVVTKAELARRLNVSNAAITQFCAQGMPVRADGALNFDECIGWLATNVAPDHSRDAGANRARHLNGTAAAASPSGPTSTYAEARRRKAAAQAELAELTLAAKRGELIARRSVKAFLQSRAMMERDAWLAWSGRIAPVIATATGADVATVTTTLDRLVRDQIREIAEMRVRINLADAIANEAD